MDGHRAYIEIGRDLDETVTLMEPTPGGGWRATVCGGLRTGVDYRLIPTHLGDGDYDPRGESIQTFGVVALKAFEAGAYRRAKTYLRLVIAMLERNPYRRYAMETSTLFNLIEMSRRLDAINIEEV